MSKVNPNKCTAEELFIAFRRVLDELLHKVVKDEHRKSKSVMALFNLIWSYVPQETDKFKIDKDGYPSIKKWLIEHLVHNKASWEAIGVEKGKLPNTTIICPRTGDEIYPPITMNGIIIDINSPQLIRRMQESVTFPSSLRHEALEIISNVYNKHIDDKCPGVRKNGGPYDTLIKVQTTAIKLQNMLFANTQTLEEKIKEFSGKMVTNHHEAMIMKEQLELGIAMSEMANNKFARASDHEIACRVVECGRNGYAKAKFVNACEGLQLAAVFQDAKTAIDNGKTLDIDILLTNIVGAFQPKEFEGTEPDSLHAAMIASSANHERPTQEVRWKSGTTIGSGGASASGGASYNGKRRYVESCTMQQNETEDQAVMNERILKALNDLKSDMGFVKKYMAAQEQAKHTEVQTANTGRFGKKNHEHVQQGTSRTKFAGVASRSTSIPQSLVRRAITTIDTSDSEGEMAFMTMRVVKQNPIPANNYRIMTADNNATVLGDHCANKVQGSVGSELGITMLNSIRIVDPIQDLEDPQSAMTMNPLSCFSNVPYGISPSAWKAVQNDIAIRKNQDTIKTSTYVETGSLDEMSLRTKDARMMQNSVSPPPKSISTWPITELLKPMSPSPAASSPTPSVSQVENFALDAGLTKNMTVSEPLVQEYDKSTESGFGRPCTRSVTRIQSFTIPPSYVPEMHELDKPIPIVKTVGFYPDPLAASTSENNLTPPRGRSSRSSHHTSSPSRRSDQDSSSEDLPELLSSSEDDDKA